MNMSDEGIRLVKSFEGYLTRQPDGSCTAYLCPAGVATIGWGCTENVRLGMRWTEGEAESGLRREIAKFEAGVQRLVTVPLNQNEFDALVSFAYNCGLGNFQKSSILRHLNAGKRDKAAAVFPLWNKARVKGKMTVLRGLTSRRAREMALFLKPVEQPAEPFMPQAPEPMAEPMSKPALTTTAVTTGVAAGGIVIPQLPPAPDLTPVMAWQGVGDTVSGAGAWMFSKPLVAGFLIAWIAAMIFLPRIAGRFGWSR